ncbi:unnamed protein product [Rotaria sp. Silwood1]|nr:unnamed protein product [Rotaria sp. Silwood1]
MAKYCNEIGKFWQLHADAIPIILINIAATTCEQSYIFRANQFKKPLNLYNCVVAKSSYGKSPMLGLVQSSILAVRDSRPMKFREVGDKLNGSNHIRVIFNEATTAGVLDSLKGCTRMLMTEEGDVILKRAMEERDDHLASRFGKSVDAVHRLAGLCQIIEFASDMVKAFVQRHGGFEDESISNEFLTKCELLFFELHGSSIENNRSFYISSDVVERAIDVISGNLEQYKLLMFIPEHEGIHFLSTLNKPVDPLMTNDIDKKAKKRLKFGKQSFEMEQAILLFDSVLFTLRTLYECRLLKNGAAVLRDMCEDLVNKELLIKEDRATEPGTKPVTIYIKALPDQTLDIECQKFIDNLASLGVEERNMAPIILNTNANDTNANDTSANDTNANDTNANDTSANDTNANDTSANDTSSNDTSANGNFSCNRDHDMPLNNYTLNNDVNENFLQSEDSTVSAVENNDNHVEVDEQMLITSDFGVLPVASAEKTEEKIQTDECDNRYEVEQNRSSDIEHPGTGKRWPPLKLKRLKSWNNDNGNSGNAVKKPKKNANINSIGDDHNESSYTTPIAGRLCRTRLPRAMF